MPRNKHRKLEDEHEITAWPSSLPEDIGSIAPPGSDLSVDYEELGCRFLSDAVEQGNSQRPMWYDEYEEPQFDPQLGNDLLRTLGLRPSKRRVSTRPRSGPEEIQKVSFAQPRLPEEFEDYITQSGEIDLTEETIREASLLDHEGEEQGDVESPFVRTDDTHSHGKRRGGHAPSVRPARGKR